MLNIAVYQGCIEELNMGEDDGVLTGIVVRRKRLETDAISETDAEDTANKFISTVEIISETEAKEFISCKTLLLCSNPSQCDLDLFTAIKDCGLVFDGGVVVDKVN